MESLRKFFSPQLQSKSAGNVERHASWLELFYDLAYVASIGALAHHVLAHFSLVTVLGSILLLAPIWWAWVGSTFYADRFDTNDPGHKLLTLGKMIAIIGMALSIPDGFDQGYSSFIGFYIVIRLLLILSYIIASKFNHSARGLIRSYLQGFTLALLIWISTIFLPIELRPFGMIVALLVEFATPYLAFHEQVKLPVDVSHVRERFGLFTIILLGEILLSMTKAVEDATSKGTVIWIALLTVILVFCIWWLYFSLEKETVLLNFRWSRLAWLNLHLVLTFGLMLFAIGIEQAILGEFSYHPETAQLFLLANGIVVLSLAGIDIVTKTKLAQGILASGSAQKHKVLFKILAGSGLIVAGVVLVPAVTVNTVVIMVGILGVYTGIVAQVWHINRRV